MSGNEYERPPTKIEHLFETVEDMEHYLRTELFAGLPSDLIDGAVQRALQVPERYGLGLLAPNPDADESDPFAERSA